MSERERESRSGGSQDGGGGWVKGRVEIEMIDWGGVLLHLKVSPSGLGVNRLLGSDYLFRRAGSCPRPAYSSVCHFLPEFQGSRAPLLTTIGI